MAKSNRHWLPDYARPERFLPRIQETRVLFRHPPYLFFDFVGQAMTFLQGDDLRKMGFEFDEAKILPCKWRCADESLFQVDLSLYAFTGLFPFDKGAIGGFFNEGSIGAAVHHGLINLDFGGSHVGYRPGPNGGTFGHIWRPQSGCSSADCGYLQSLITPFRSVYTDACDNILLFKPEGEDHIVASVPNEFLQPNWSYTRLKLLVDLDVFTSDRIDYIKEKDFTHAPAARTLFYVSDEFIESLPTEELSRLSQSTPQPLGPNLKPGFFSIFDAEAELDAEGLPKNRLLLYMPNIVAASYSPPSLKAAIINTNLEHNRLSDAVRAEEFIPYSFASFTGVFIDLFDEQTNSYHNLFQPIGLTIKPAGTNRQFDLAPEEIYERIDQSPPALPRIPLGRGAGLGSAERLLKSFTFEPGRFK